jgi:hypothetical protein
MCGVAASFQPAGRCQSASAHPKSSCNAATAAATVASQPAAQAAAAANARWRPWLTGQQLQEIAVTARM